MLAILTFIFVLVISMLVVRVATVALVLTGLSHSLARFQARSAFTGTGFTSSESEQVVSHPVRRRIIMLLMLLGNAGIVTAVSTLIISFANVTEEKGLTGSLWFRVGLLVVGLTILWLFANSRWVDRRLSRIITRALRKWTDLEAHDYASLLHLTGGYAVAELVVEPTDWIVERTLSQLRLSREGVLVLGIERTDGHYIGAPRGETVVHAGDLLLIYGRGKALADLDARRAGPEGNRKHIEAVVEQAQVERAEREPDEQAQTAKESAESSPNQ